MKSTKYSQPTETPIIALHVGRITSIIDWRLKAKPKHMEFPTGESMAIPDQSYSIKDLVKKMARGVDPAISKVATYGGEDDEVDFDDIDLNQAQHADLADTDEIKQAAQRQLLLLQQMQEAKNQQENSAKKASEKATDLGHEKGSKNEAQKSEDSSTKTGSENDPK